MKKIITLSLSILIASVGFTQNAPINFETGGQGAGWTWTTFENTVANPALEVVNNPSSVAPNTSAKVGKFTALKDGQPYAGCESKKTVDIGTFVLTSANAIVKIMVWKPVISDVGIKFATDNGASTGEIKVANTKINEWEELTFNFTSKIGEPSSTGITQIVIFPDFVAGTALRTRTAICYFDNITFSASGPVSNVPTVPALAPTKPAADVISLYSGAYTNVPIDTWRTGWSNGTLTDTTIGTDAVKRYSALDFVGIEMVANQININSMEFFEFDVWTPNSTSLRFKLVDFGANGTFGGGDDKEHETTVTPTLRGWNRISVPIAGMTGLTSKANIAQLIFASSPAGTSTIYLDNIMFSKATALAVPALPAMAPTKPAADVISLYSGVYTNVPIDTWRTSWSNATLTEMKIGTDSVKKYSALDFVGVEMVANQININSMGLFEFDVWTPNSTSLRFKLVDFGANGAFGGGDDKEHETTVTPTINGWFHVAVPISSMTGLTSKSNIAQLIFSSSPTGTSVIYIDNVLFSKAVVVAEPTVAAKTPTKLAADVISMYSDAYTDVPVDTWRTSWSVATLTDMKIGTDSVKKYSGLDFVGIETVSKQIDITNMDSFEFDMWTPNSTSFRYKLVDFGADGAFAGGDDKEHELTATPTLNGWNHIAVPLSSFTGLTTKKNIAQLVFASAPSGTSIVYIDNVFFSKKAAVGLASTKLETVGIFPNPANNVLNLSTTNAIQDVVIYNAMGQVVLTASPNANSVNIDIAELPMGLYTVKASINCVDTFSKVIKK